MAREESIHGREAAHTAASLVLRLAGPLQSWGAASQFNRRETANAPTKGGVIGLLAAAQGRRRSDPIEDLLALTLAVRTDQQGSLLRDYHTVSDYRGGSLPSANVNAKGQQQPAGGKKTHVTQRYYLQDAVFVAAVGGPADTSGLLGDLAWRLRRPKFPLALGRRACIPTMPLVLPYREGDPGGPTDVWPMDPVSALNVVPWQASASHRRKLASDREFPAWIDLPVTVDDLSGDDVRTDVPRSFSLTYRGFATRRVRNGWARVATEAHGSTSPRTVSLDEQIHDPFALLGW